MPLAGFPEPHRKFVRQTAADAHVAKDSALALALGLTIQPSRGVVGWPVPTKLPSLLLDPPAITV